MPKYNDDNTIDLEIDHPTFGLIPFTANPEDPAGAGIYAAALAGEYGPIDPYIEPPSPTPGPPHVPQSVTRRQARQALLMAGHLASVQPAIDAIVDPMQRGMVQIEWDDSQSFDRQRPALIALATAIGMTGEQIDDLFVSASQL